MEAYDYNPKKITLNHSSERKENKPEYKDCSNSMSEQDKQKIVNYTKNMPFTIKIY